ncbi:GvpL/GvpF family gas vesicle protein [Streptomyces sp. NPDC005551]|uniref:GvpL/GvpF family gas vesicle protein n=1 Tax=Streptomyces sp. NPDC005551 TaxID=3364725 RepID=UPI00369DBCE3
MSRPQDVPRAPLRPAPEPRAAVTGQREPEPPATGRNPRAREAQDPAGPAVTYLFAVTRTPPPDDVLAGVAGQDGGGPLRVLRAGSLALVVQDVPAEAFGKEALTQRFNDRYQLERCARAHHRGVQAAAGHGPVVPLPLATLYLSDRNAAEAVACRETAVHTLLDRLRGRTEWAVKVHAAEHDGDPSPAPEAGAENAAPGGRAYLARASTRQRAQRARREGALARAHALDLELRRHVVAATRHRTQSEQLTGRSTPQLLNAAYLVDDGQRAAFGRALDGLRADERYRGLEIDESGPWIPYSFAQLDEAPDDSECGVGA